MRPGLPHLALVGSAGLFILAVLLAESLPGLSRLVHLSVGLMLVSLLWKAKQEPITLTADPLPWLFWIFFLFTFASVLWAAQPLPAAVRSVSILFDVLGATLIWIALFNRLSLIWVVACAALGASVQAGVALFQFWTGSEVRVDTLVNPNHLAVQLSLVAFLLLLVIRRHWFPGVLALSLLVIATITSGSRKMVFVWFIYLLLLSRWLTLGLKRSTIVAAALLLLLPAFILLLIDNRDQWLEPIENLTVYQRIDRALAGEDSSAVKRENLIGDSLEVWKLSPVWGHGVDQYRYMNPLQVYAHNNYTELLANLGLIGLILYYAIHLNLAWRAASLVRRRGSGRSWLIIAIVLMLFLLDLARVSHTDRLTWMLLAVMGFVCYREEHGGSGSERNELDSDGE